MSARPPGAQRVPRQRLNSIRNIRRGSVASNASGTGNNNNSNSGGQQQARRPAARRICANCKSENIIEDDGQLVCANCASVYDSSNIVSDITFGETSTGQAVVQGSHIGENQRFAQTLGAHAPRGAQGPGSSRDHALKAGREEIWKLSEALGVQGQRERAGGLYALASTNQFTQGRNTRAVAAICLYFCCRNYEPENKILLMDFSERIKVNVYRLGDTYKEFCKKMYLADDAIDKASRPLKMNPQVEIEPLIRRYCRRLEFGRDTLKVAEDACRVMARWDRDWMVTGRRPSGLCGAAIIIGARMNNYRRSVREVVYIVKASDMTIIKRLEEFKQTTSSRMTVDQFKKGGYLLREEHDPPSIRYHEENKKKVADRRARVRAASLAAASVPPEEADMAQDPTSTEQADSAPAAQEPRRDADGFIIPALPIDPNLTHSAASPGPASREDVDEYGNPITKKRKRGRPRKEPLQKMEVKASDLAFERHMTKQIEAILHNEVEMDEVTFDKLRQDAEQRALHQKEQERQAKGRNTASTPGEVDLDSPFIDPHEFDDDPDVMNSLYAPEERAIREMIWLNENEDWLRSQQKKAMDRTLEEARNGGVKKPAKQRKRLGRIGDGSLLQQAGPVASAAEATQTMIEKRNPKFSKHVNYAKIQQIYGHGPSSTTSGSDTGSTADGRDSRASSVVSDASTVVPHPGGLPTPSATQRRNAQEKIGDASANAGDEEDEDMLDDEDEEEEEDDDVRGALSAIGDKAGAMGFGSPGAEDEEEDARGLDDEYDGYEGEEYD